MAAVAAKNQDHGWDAGAVEEVRRQTDHGIEQVLFDQGAADLAFGAAAEKHAVGHDDTDPAGALGGRHGPHTEPA